MEELGDELLNLGLNNQQEIYENENIRPNQSKVTYKDRKIDHKLKKYETILKNLENINRETKPSKVSIIVFFK
jgi:hypothetical protein